MNYQEIDRDEFHALLCDTQQCDHILVNNHPYTCDQLYLTPYNPELTVLPLRYLDGAVKVVKPGKTVLYTSDSVHANPYTIEIVSGCL